MEKDSLSKKYENIITGSGIASPGLVKGTLFIHPKGCHIWEQIQKHIDREFKAVGIKNVAFPALIPLAEMQKEKSKLSGFHPELFLVSKTGSKENSPSVFLRPTSEILFSHFFRKTLHSHEQLPVLLNQWCSVYRAEKNTKAFLRNCEFYWQEAHTLHKTKQDALDYLQIFHNIYKKVVRDVLNLEFLEGEKTVNERFQGAEHTLALEAVMPDGQALQIATSHYLGTNFSSIFDITYTSNENKLEHPHQLSAGSSTRLIGALVLGHSDEKGLVLPFLVADVQIKILVIDQVVSEGDEMHKRVSSQLSDYLVEWNYSSKSVGFRLNNEEIAGTPFVILIGKQEIQKQQVTIKSRIDTAKQTVDIDSLGDYLKKAVDNYSQELLRRSKANMDNYVVDMREGVTLDSVKKAVLEDGKVALVPWFDDETNEETFKKEGFGFGSRCIHSRFAETGVKCFYSGKAANSYVYFGRSY